MPSILFRPVPEQAEQRLPHLPPVLARIYAARGIYEARETELQLQHLLSFQTMRGIDSAVALLEPVVIEGKKLLIVGDFDVDGASSAALAIRALRMMGAQSVDYLVPNRFEHGYGLSPELAKLAVERQPDLIMTVDNGIAAHEGIAVAQSAGIPVLVTDHHLAGEALPDAAAIVNPNQPGCEFPSKAACGCTVVFYVMLALRAHLVNKGIWSAQEAPKLAVLLDLVALATVADVVPLDANNRILVEQGLRRIRAGHAHAGVMALIRIAGRNPSRLVASDLGFALGPRLNAAGRLDDMSVGIECLLSDDANHAMSLAQILDEMNRDRREIEQGMQQEALHYLQRINMDTQMPTGICLYQSDWHQGVIGILASRIKEHTHRPVIAFALSEDGTLKGSARSIAGLHIRDALDEVHKQAPNLMVRFGGHAMAAGLTLIADGFAEFAKRFDEVCRKHLTAAQLEECLEVDGSLEPHELELTLAEQLRLAGPWGQGFPAPLFVGEFMLVQQRVVGEKHVKMLLQPLQGTHALDAIWFFASPLAPAVNGQMRKVRAVYQLDVNEYRDQFSVQLMIRHLEPMDDQV